MKKYFILLALTVASLLTFTSCSTTETFRSCTEPKTTNYYVPVNNTPTYTNFYSWYYSTYNKIYYTPAYNDKHNRLAPKSNSGNIYNGRRKK